MTDSDREIDVQNSQTRDREIVDNAKRMILTDLEGIRWAGVPGKGEVHAMAGEVTDRHRPSFQFVNELLLREIFDYAHHQAMRLWRRAIIRPVETPS